MRAVFTVKPEPTPGYCETHEKETVLYETVNDVPGKGRLLAMACVDCIAELKHTLKKHGVKIIDQRGN